LEQSPTSMVFERKISTIQLGDPSTSEAQPKLLGTRPTLNAESARKRNLAYVIQEINAHR
jgi:hypothetical protein